LAVALIRNARWTRRSRWRSGWRRGGRLNDLAIMLARLGNGVFVAHTRMILTRPRLRGSVEPRHRRSAPRAKFKLASVWRRPRAAHHMALQMGVGLSSRSGCGGMATWDRGRAFEPVLIVVMQAAFHVVDEGRWRMCIALEPAPALRARPHLAETRLDLGRVNSKPAAGGTVKPEFLTVRFLV